MISAISTWIYAYAIRKGVLLLAFKNGIVILLFLFMIILYIQVKWKEIKSCLCDCAAVLTYEQKTALIYCYLSQVYKLTSTGKINFAILILEIYGYAMLF